MAGRCAHWGGLAALGTVAVWTPVLAQQAPVISNQAAGVAPLGDVRALTITSQVETTYDTNVARTDAAGAAALHLTPEDVYVEPTLLIDGLLPVSRESLFLTGLVGYDFYDHNTVLNRERIDLTGGAAARLARCEPRITGNYDRRQTELNQLLAGPGTPTATPRNVATQAGVTAAFACPRAEGLSPTFSVTHSTYDNSNAVFKATNNSSTSAMGGLSFARPGFGAIQAYGNFVSVDYDNGFAIPVPPFQLKTNYNLYSGGVRYDRPIDSRLSGTISVSYSSLRPDSSLRFGFSGLTYSAELTYQMSSRLGLHALVSRATLPTNQVGTSYIIDNKRQIDATYSVGARLKLTLGGYDGPQTYEGALAGVPDVLTSARTDRVFGSANFALNRRVSVVLDATDEHRNADVALFRYTSNRVSLTLKGVF